VGGVGALDFVGRAKVVGPGGDILEATGVGPGVATAALDVDAEIAAHRAGMCNLRDRRPDAYRLGVWEPV
jgi:predicted amidohydrolase